MNSILSILTAANIPSFYSANNIGNKQSTEWIVNILNLDCNQAVKVFYLLFFFIHFQQLYELQSGLWHFAIKFNGNWIESKYLWKTFRLPVIVIIWFQFKLGNKFIKILYSTIQNYGCCWFAVYLTYPNPYAWNCNLFKCVSVNT